ncbi:MAG: VCBS repeat-containing protein [Planctomycetes bacterium]|nr:VCBS repeat-containing protein [Planctomycetota bacterium]
MSSVSLRAQRLWRSSLKAAWAPVLSALSLVPCSAAEVTAVGNLLPADQSDSSADAVLVADAGAALTAPVNEPLVPADVPQPLRSAVQSRFYQGSSPSRFAWHLAVLNAGQPRMQSVSLSANESTALQVAWPKLEMGEAFWLSRVADRKPGLLEARFGHLGGVPVCGDFSGTGQAQVGVFINGQWFIDLNGNGRWDEADLWVKFGGQGDQPVIGDWDGDGKDDIGVFGPTWGDDDARAADHAGLPDADNRDHRGAKNWNAATERTSHGLIRLGSNATAKPLTVRHTFFFGAAGDVPVVGDWNGDGIDTVGIFRRGRWVLDADGDGRFSEGDASFDLGAEQDRPVVADFDGDGKTNVGVYRRGTWLLDVNGDRRLTDADGKYQFGTPTDVPVVADFHGDGKLLLGVYRNDGSKNKSL